MSVVRLVSIDIERIPIIFSINAFVVRLLFIDKVSFYIDCFFEVLIISSSPLLLE